MRLSGNELTDWNRRESILQKVVQGYVALLKLAERKRDVLLNESIAELRQVSALEEAQIVTLAQCLSNYREEFGIPEDHTIKQSDKLSFQFKGAPEEVRKNAAGMMSELSELGKQLEIVNYQNRELLRVSSAITSGVLDTLMPDRNSDKIYGATGDLRPGVSKGIFDRKS